jgi:hypothetical protein
MRLKTRTWDLNGPQFTLKVFTEVKEGDGYTRYKCELSFSADQKCLPYSPVELNKNTY